MLSMPSNTRIAIVGTSGSGKTTLAKQISMHLGIQHVELDAYRHGPNWTESPDASFRRDIKEALSTSDWIVDGNYSVVRVQKLLGQSATDKSATAD